METALGLQMPTSTDACSIYAQRPNNRACGPSHKTVSPFASAARVLPRRLPHHDWQSERQGQQWTTTVEELRSFFVASYYCVAGMMRYVSS